MPLYEAIAKGFRDRIYKAGETFRTDEPLGEIVEKKKGVKERVLPSWVKEVDDETQDQRSARKETENAQALDRSQKKAQKAADKAKAARQGSQPYESNSTGDGAVETL